jgi:hypothetical protein
MAKNLLALKNELVTNVSKNPSKGQKWGDSAGRVGYLKSTLTGNQGPVCPSFQSL